jgi:hypothetical protein
LEANKKRIKRLFTRKAKSGAFSQFALQSNGNTNSLSREHRTARNIMVKHNSGGDASEAIMLRVAELLQQKRTLLDRKQMQLNPKRAAEIDRHIAKIDDALNQLEAKQADAPPIAPH